MLRRVSKGQPVDFSTAKHNAFVDSANDYLSRKLRRQFAGGWSEGGPGTLSVTNGTGGARGQYDVVALGAPTNDPDTELELFKSRRIVAASTPATADAGNFAVLLRPLPSGATQSTLAAVAGVVPVQLTVPANGTWINWADVDDGEHTLILTPHGTARVIWREGGTSGLEWALVQLGIDRGTIDLKATASGAITAGGSGTVDIYQNGSATGFTVMAYLNWMHGSENISSGKELIIRWFQDEDTGDGQWVIVAAECET